MSTIVLPIFESDNAVIDSAFRIAYSDIVGNIIPCQDGELTEKKNVIMAGLEYPEPWTRDASINVWNCGGLFFKEEAKNTLLAVLKRENGKVRVGGQYWDAVIWVIGAWNLYLYTGDRTFLERMLEIAGNTLEYFEETEFDPDRNLFRGPACYGDGVAAYPDIYAKHKSSGILECVEQIPGKAKKGYGIPMFTLSVNCLYYEAYRIAALACGELKKGGKEIYEEKAANMKAAVNKHFWMEEKGTYRYIVDDFGGCDGQESMGLGFAVLFGVADGQKAERIMKNAHITDQGVPCVWPSFSRYDTPDGMGFGRHSGTVWPHVEALYADAACKVKRADILETETALMAARAVRDGHFAEIYHPLTGEIYGGRQECEGKGIIEWKATKKQTWSATGFMRLILMDLLGMDFEPDGIYFKPTLICGIKEASLKGLEYRNAVLNIQIKESEEGKTGFYVNGKQKEGYFIPENLEGICDVMIYM